MLLFKQQKYEKTVLTEEGKSCYLAHERVREK